MHLLLILLACGGDKAPGETADPFTTTTTWTGTTTDTLAKQAECAALRGTWQQQYDSLLSDHKACGTNEECHAPWGACATGLGGCQEAVNAGLTQDQIDQVSVDYADAAAAAGCDDPSSYAICDCYGGYTAMCEGFVCTLVYSGYGTP